MRKRENSCRRRSVAPQTTYVFTLFADEPSIDGSCLAPKLLAGRLGIAGGVKRTLWNLVHKELNASRKLLANVKAARSLTIVPIEGIPVRPMTRSEWWALLAGGFATPHVLLSVDDPIRVPGPTAQIGAACLSQRHAKSLHKTPVLDGDLPGEVG
jgi:hypothetical protein